MIRVMSHTPGAKGRRNIPIRFRLKMLDTGRRQDGKGAVVEGSPPVS